MTHIETMKKALDALTQRAGTWGSSKRNLEELAIAALRAAIEQPESEPVAFRHSFDGYGWMYVDSGSGSSWQDMQYPDKQFVYTAPVSHVPLSDSDIKRILVENGFKTYPECGDDLKPYCYQAIRAIERAVKGV